MKRLIMLLLILTAVPYIATAAEVKNVKVSQVGNNAVATYDLVGGAGEQDAEVTVAITIGNDKRTSDQLSLNGDFGKKVKVGTGKKIVWNVMKDFPSGPEGDLSWEVKVKKDNSKELEETMQWIQNKSASAFEIFYTYNMPDIYNHSEYISDFKVNYNGCDITIEYQNRSAYLWLNMLKIDIATEEDKRSAEEMKVSYRFNLKNIGSVAVEQLQNDKYRQYEELVYALNIKTYNDIKNIEASWVITKREGTASKNSKDKAWLSNGISLVTKDQNMADRMAKAFSYAVQLCGGGKEEKF